jgi:hypothetical protein
MAHTFREEAVMDIISRGFSGRRKSTDVKLPPGQYLTAAGHDPERIRTERFGATGEPQ